MNILCNLPLECFDERAAFADRFITFAPADRMCVDGAHWPFDVEFDPSSASVHDLWRALPTDFAPDVLLLYWPDQEPLPDRLHECPVPVIGVVSDYNLSLPYLAGLWPFFDVLLTDRSGVGLFEKLAFPDVRYFCQYSFKRPNHRVYRDEPKEIDIAFAGNLNPVVQRGRAPWIDRLLRLERDGLRVAVQSGICGEAYGRFLNRTRIGFNRSVRGEMNLRAFEVPACGAMLMMEAANLEVREFFAPGEEVVLYDDDDFEELVAQYASNETERARVAQAGFERVQDYRMSKRLRAMADVLAAPGPGRPQSSPFDRAYGRGVAMLATWARGKGPIQCLLDATKLAPTDPRPHNALAIALLRSQGDRFVGQVLELLQKACALSDSYVPAALNLATLLTGGGKTELGEHHRAGAEQRLADDLDWPDLDGPVLPLGYGDRAVRIADALTTAVRRGDIQRDTAAAFA